RQRLRVREREFLPGDVESGLFQFVGDVLGGGVEALRARRAVAVVHVGDPLQRAEVPVQLPQRDLLGQLVRQIGDGVGRGGRRSRTDEGKARTRRDRDARPPPCSQR